MIDPELKYCPQCSDEYRAEIERCAACEVSLVFGKEIQKQKQKRLDALNGNSADADLVPIFKASMQEIRRLEALLKNEEIDVFITGEDSDEGCGKGCCGSSSMFLNVHRYDMEEAVRIIEQDDRKNTSWDTLDHSHADAVFNANAAETTCPACGENFAPTENICPECGLCFSP